MPMSPLPNCAVSLPPPPEVVAGVVLLLSSLEPQAAKKAAAAAEPPLNAMNLRRDTGSLASRVIVPEPFPWDRSSPLLPDMHASSVVAFWRFPTPRPGRTDQSPAKSTRPGWVVDPFEQRARIDLTCGAPLATGQPGSCLPSPWRSPAAAAPPTRRVDRPVP